MTGSQIFRMRVLYGYSLRQVAQEAGISHNLIQLVEKGERSLTEDAECKILNGIYRLNMKEALMRAGKTTRGGNTN